MHSRTEPTSPRASPCSPPTRGCRWELENSIHEVDEAMFKYDAEEQKATQSQRPWAKDPHHFKQ